MKPRLLSTARLSFPLATAIAALISAQSASAASLTWDAGNTSNGSTIDAGNGAWDLSAINWNNGAGNEAWTQAATNDGSNAAIFAGVDGAVDTYEVSVGEDIAAESLTFDSSGYMLTGSTLALIVDPVAGTNGNIIVAAGKTATIDSTLRYLDNKSATITSNAGSILNLGGGTTPGADPQMNLSGAGTINISGGTYGSTVGTWGANTMNQTGGTVNMTQGGSNIGHWMGRNGGQDQTYTISGGTLNVQAENSTSAGYYLGLGRNMQNFKATLVVKDSAVVNIGNATDRSGQLNLGSNDGNGNSLLDVQGGTLTIGTGKATNKLLFFAAGSNAGKTATMTQSGGVVTSNGIQFGANTGGSNVDGGGSDGSKTYSGTSLATLQLSGGSLYVGSLGITRGSAAAALPVTIQLQGGTLGADQNWSSSLDMKLGTTAGGPTIRAQDSGSNARDITLSGVLSDDGAVNGTLTKTGTGILTLSGTNTYTGATTVSTGTLQLGNGSTTGALTGTASITNNATLAVNRSDAFTQATDLNGKIISGSGSFTQAGSGTTTLSLANTYTGTTTISAGKILMTNASALQYSAYNTTGSTGAIGLDVTSGLSSGSLTLGGLTGGVNVATAITGYGSVTNLTLNPQTGSSPSYSGVIANGATNMTLTKTGAGTQILTAANTYTGDTTISGGVLQLTETGNLGSGNYAGAMSISSGATFEKSSSGTQLLSGAITGAGTLTNSGGGGLVLSNADNSYGALSISNASSRVFINHATALPDAATVEISSGALVFGASATRANAITVASGGTLSARAATTLSNVTLPGSGTVIFNNDDANTNLLTISNNQTLTGALTVQVGGTRMQTTGGSIGMVNLSGNIIGEGSLVMTSSGNASNPNFQTGALTLSGNNTYTGATTVSAGTLFVTGSLTSDVSVSNAATLGGGGTVGAVSFGGGSYFDIALAVGSLDSLTSTTISFAATGFGIENLRYNGAAVDWSTIGDNTYTLISGDLTETNLGNFGLANAYDIGGGRSAYFTDGSLQLVVIPEPRAAFLGGLGLLGLLRRRR